MKEGYWIRYLVRFQKNKAKNRRSFPFGNDLLTIIAVLVIASIMFFRYGDTVTAVSAAFWGTIGGCRFLGECSICTAFWEEHRAYTGITIQN